MTLMFALLIVSFLTTKRSSLLAMSFLNVFEFGTLMFSNGFSLHSKNKFYFFYFFSNVLMNDAYMKDEKKKFVLSDLGTKSCNL